MSGFSELLRQSVGQAVPEQVAVEGDPPPFLHVDGPLIQFLAPINSRLKYGGLSYLAGGIVDLSLSASYGLAGMSTAIGLDVFGANPVASTIAGIAVGGGLKLLSNGVENHLMNRAHGISLGRRGRTPTP